MKKDGILVKSISKKAIENLRKTIQNLYIGTKNANEIIIITPKTIQEKQ